MIINRISVLLALTLCFGFTSCNSQRGHDGVSKDMSESKERDVFVCEYSVPENPYKVNDSITLTVKEAWLERAWKYPENNSETSISEGYQICVSIEPEKHIEDLGFGWSIGIDYDKNIRISSPTSLIGDFKVMPPDTIEYKVQKGGEFSAEYEKIIIGKFVLIKK